jgi:hypothetical protein
MQQTSLNTIPTKTLYEQPVVYTKIHLQINDSTIALVGFMMFNATFNNISAISWQSVLLVEETGENHQPASSH